MDADPGAGEGPCLCCSSGVSWRRSVKRKLEAAKEVGVGVGLAVARVEAEEEAAALREAVAAAQETIAALRAEVEEERGAAASAASEAMAMMLRLQREKAEVQMEHRQFRRFADEKMALDADELAQLDLLLARRDAALASLRSRLRSYCLHFHRLGLPLPDDDDLHLDDLDLDDDHYPRLRCSDEDHHLENDGAYGYGYGYGYDYDHQDVAVEEEDAPSPLPLMDLERRIYRLEHEESPTAAGSVYEKAVVEPDASPVASVHERSHLYEDGDEGEPEEEFPESPVASVLAGDGEEDRSDNGSGGGTDRVYTIDTVHGQAVPTVRVSEEEGWEGRKEAEPDIKKLYMRLESLEADRESMRQALMAMRTEKAQLVLLREIAQQLAKDAAPAPAPVPAPAVPHLPVKPVVVERRVEEMNRALVRTFSILALFKWILTLIFWRKQKPYQSRYTFGVSSNNVGLLVLLDKYPRIQKNLSRTH